MVIDPKQDDESGSANNGSGNNDAVATAAANAAPINATSNSAQNNSAQGMERSLPSEEVPQEEIKPERNYQEEAAKEVTRLLGRPDAEAEAAARSSAAGGHVMATEAATASIVNTNAGNVRNNAELAAQIAEALKPMQHLQAQFASSMQNFSLAGHAQFSDEKKQVGTAQEQTGPTPSFA